MAQNIQVTINREFGSGGRLVGEALAKKFNIKLVDKIILEEVAKQLHMSPKYLQQFEEKAPSIWDTFTYSTTSFHGMSLPMQYNKITNNELYVSEVKYIKEVASKNSCVFIGRCANYILRDTPNVMSVYLYADMITRKNNLINKYGFKATKHIEKEIERIDKQRADYYRLYTGENWRDIKQYDLCINTSDLSIEQIVEIIYNYGKLKFKF